MSDFHNTINNNFNINLEESDDDSFKIIKGSNRTRSHGKLIFSKNYKNIKKHSLPKLCLSLNIYNSTSTPSLNNISAKQKSSIMDYDTICDLGNGSYGKVILAKSINEGKKYAIKVIKKALLDRFEKQYEIHVEKYCLSHLSHPNIIKFNKAFQDKAHLYFVLEYCKNRDLGKLLQKIGPLNFKLAQYYSAEIISAISYMNKLGIYHRDLKPENIGIDEDMHLKIFDFATANIYGKYFDKNLMKFIDISKKEYELIKNEKNKENILNFYTILFKIL